MTLDRARAIRVLHKASLALAELRMILAADDDAPADPQSEMVERLRQACHEKGIDISLDGDVGEADAARLLNRAPNTLRGWRDTHRPIPFRKPLGRIRYDLRDLATFISDNSEQEPPE